MLNIKSELPDVSKLKELAKERNLTLFISEKVIQSIRNAHFKEGLSINRIKDVYQKDLLNIGLLYKTKAGKISKRFVQKGSEFILILLGYSSWEAYKKKSKILFLNSEKKLTNEISQLDLTKEKNISEIMKKLNLNIKFTMTIIEEIRKMHFEAGASMLKIARDLESDLKELGWLKPNEYRIYRKKYKTPVFKMGVSRFLYYILGYKSFEDYQVNQKKKILKPEIKYDAIQDLLKRKRKRFAILIKINV